MKLLLSTLFIWSFLTFSQTPGNGVVDIEGNVYGSVILGNQEWMNENLRVKRYSNGDLINTTQSTEWHNYNNDTSFFQSYGLLYAHNVVLDNRNVCPIGWGIPSSNDFEQLGLFLGGALQAGGVMKETGYNYWNSPNYGATNLSMFNARGAGKIELGNVSVSQKLETWWWTTDVGFGGSMGSGPITFKLSYMFDDLIESNINELDFVSIRCLKNLSVELNDKSGPSLKPLLLKITDVMGREVPFEKNKVLIYVYSDGTTERVFEFE